MSTTTAGTTTSRRHVAFCPFPFTSHPGSMLLLAKKITAAAPDTKISLLTTDRSAAALSSSLYSEERAHIRVILIDDGLAGAEGTPFIESIAKFVDVAEESLRKGLAAAEEAAGAKIGCIVADTMLMCPCRTLAEARGVKWVAFYNSSSASLITHIYTDRLREAVAPEGIDAHRGKGLTVDMFIPGFPPGIPLEDLPIEILGLPLDFPIVRVLDLIPHHIHKATAIAVNSFNPFELTENNILGRILGKDKLHVTGPFELTLSNPSIPTEVADPNGCLAWLDTHKAASVIYIGFGTSSVPPPEKLCALAEALEAARAPFLFSLPDRFKSSLPKGFLERIVGYGKVVPWAPQTSVLGHVATGAHLTHCGWNSVLESILAGVPMICMPTKMADQVFNARRMVGETGWGIGIEVEGGRLTKALLDRVMLGDEGRKMRDKVVAMKKLAHEAGEGSSARNLDKFISIIISES